MLLACLIMPGCGGCGDGTSGESADEQAQEDAEKEKSKQREKPKPPFEAAKLHIQPNMPASDRVFSVKPGHWTMATVEMKANNFHYNGDLDISTADRAGTPAIIESTPYTVSTVRSAPLPKGQAKFLEFATFVPRGIQGLRLVAELRAPSGGVTETYPEVLSQMRPHQYYFLILSAQPEAFRPLTRNDPKFDTIRAPGHEGNLNHYRVVAPPIKNRVPLPTNGLAWSSIAYVLWDDIDPALLDVDQRQALLDWLHFGGQLIVSGPGTLDKLKGSFLDPSKDESFLPATASASIKLSPDEVARMANPWNTPGKNGLNGRGLVVARDWSVVALDKQPHARFVEDTNKQVVERQIGRGRIVVTSFRIGQPGLLNWASFDCFLNAVLLRRQARQFEAVPDSLSQVAMKWLLEDGSLSADTRDARLVTTLRWFSRDIDKTGKAAHEGRVSDLEVTTAMTPSGPFDLEQPAPLVLEEQAEANAQGSGIGGWNDFAGVPAAARSSLREAAGIKIPNAAFVVFVLAVYLAVLVPLNWGIFRVVGRIELAWIAAPLIAIAGALSVIKLAELDIGFARSETEISVLEAHANYPRAHLTRYTALYASLGTTYDLVFEDKNALALPFPADENYQRLRGESIDRVEYHRDETGARLAGFTVKSNSTGMVHSEQMYDLGGVLTYALKDGRHEVYNRTKYVIHNAGVIRRAANHKLEVAWLGDLYPGQGAQASFTTAPSRRPLLAQWDLDRESTAESDRPLQRLLNLAQQPAELEAGEVRLLGIIREPLAGISIEPAPSQSDRCPTLIIAHLKHAYLENHAPRPDANSRAAIKEELIDPEDE